MKIDIQTLKDTFEVGYQTYQESYNELDEIENLYHNRQYTMEQLNVLAERGSPAETFNIIKLFDRSMLGYFSTVINDIKAVPLEEYENDSARRFNRALQYILRQNNFSLMKENILQNSLHAGLIITSLNVKKTGDTDKYGRPHIDINLKVINPKYVVLDPKSEDFDYSDARFFHTFKWLDEPTIKKMVGSKKFNKLQSNTNYLNIQEAEYTEIYGATGGFNGHYRLGDEYLVVTSMIKDNNGDWWTVLWCGDEIIAKEKVPYDEALPYRVVKLHQVNKPEFYGIYRELIGIQHSINQAVLQIQLLVNNKRVIVQDGAVNPEDWEQFQKDFNKVNKILHVNFLDGIRIEKFDSEIAENYRVISNALDRAQKLLHINDAFLGQSAASESGRKMNLQKTSSIVQLRYVVTRLEFYYQVLGRDLLSLIKQYINAEISIPSEDDFGNQEFEAMNVPLIDPSTGKPAIDYVKNTKGEYEGELINDPDTELVYNKMDISVTASNFDDSAEADKLMLEQTLATVGPFLQQADPVAYLKVSSLLVKQKRTRHSGDIAKILEQVAGKLEGAQVQDPRAAMQTEAGGSNVGSPGDIAHTMGLSNEIVHPKER